MIATFPRAGRLAALAILAALALVAFAACGDDGAAEVGPLPGVTALDTLGYHELDEELTTTEEIPATLQSTATKMLAIVRLTAWPEDAGPIADELDTSLEELIAELDAEAPDVARAIELSNRIHDLWHDLSDDIWERLYAEAGIEGSGDHGQN